jgi:glycosyltransferase involved in cell wall biosynthesis
MRTPKITVAIPTYNRSELLKVSLRSVLEQDYPDWRVVVLYDASTEDTEKGIQFFSDSIGTYVRNDKNVGLFRNWRRAIDINSSPYLQILQDDDVMLQGFIRESVAELEKNPKASFSFVLAGSIDINGVPHGLIDADDLPDTGIMKGIDYLHRVVAGHRWVIYSSAVMMRAAAISDVGSFENIHSVYSMDYNIYFRLAACSDIIFINKELIKVRKHKGQITQSDSSLLKAKGQLPLMAERTDAVAHLLKSVRAEDASYRQWLGDRLLHISMLRSDLTQSLVPELNLSWTERLEIAKQEISTHIPKGISFILIDEDKWGPQIAPDCNVIPFLGHNGCSWGPPADDETAMREIKRLRKAGASFIVFGWPAFWWFDYYYGMHEYLRSQFSCILKNSRLVIFDLQP